MVCFSRSIVGADEKRNTPCEALRYMKSVCSFFVTGGRFTGGWPIQAVLWLEWGGSHSGSGADATGRNLRANLPRVGNMGQICAARFCDTRRGLAHPFCPGVCDQAQAKSKSPPCPSKERRDEDGAPLSIPSGS